MGISDAQIHAWLKMSDEDRAAWMAEVLDREGWTEEEMGEGEGLDVSELSDEIQNYMKVRQIAKVFLVQPQTVRNWIKAGKLPSSRLVGRSLMAHRDDVTALFRSKYGKKG